MKEIKIAKILETLCPHTLAPFDFNGFLTQTHPSKKIQKLFFTLGFSLLSIQKAAMQGADMLVMHNAPENLEILNNQYFERIKQLLQKNNLSVYRLHLPLDFVKGGIIDQLGGMMGFSAKPTNLLYEKTMILGGVYLAKEKVTLDEVIKRVYLLQPATIRIVYGKKRQIRNIAITSGDGCKPEFLLQLKPDIFICGLLNQEAIRVANDLGITLIEATSYATENSPMKRFVERNKHHFSNVDIRFLDIKNDVKNVIL